VVKSTKAIGWQRGQWACEDAVNLFSRPLGTVEYSIRAASRAVFGNKRPRGPEPGQESLMAEYVVEFGKDGRPVEPDGRLDAPAFHRNHQAIRNVLQASLAGKSGEVLEAGSGTGQHVIDFARHFPDILWWPSDFNEQHLKSIAAWREHAGLPNLRPPLRIDLSDPAWCPEMEDGRGPGELLAVFCANVIHIAPWRVAEGLVAGAGRYLRADGRLFLYGPFKRGGQHTAPSNAAFDTSLREGNPEWGVRDIEAVEALAARTGLRLADIAEMPANNLTLVFERLKTAS
jgi:SAM-dependent methyltransferase